jgi:hypothetical protein
LPPQSDLACSTTLSRIQQYVAAQWPNDPRLSQLEEIISVTFDVTTLAAVVSELRRMLPQSEGLPSSHIIGLALWAINTKCGVAKGEKEISVEKAVGKLRFFGLPNRLDQLIKFYPHRES